MSGCWVRVEYVESFLMQVFMAVVSHFYEIPEREIMFDVRHGTMGIQPYIWCHCKW